MWTIYERLGIISLGCPYQSGAAQVTSAANVCNTDSSTKLKGLVLCIVSSYCSESVYIAFSCPWLFTWSHRTNNKLEQMWSNVYLMQKHFCCCMIIMSLNSIQDCKLSFSDFRDLSKNDVIYKNLTSKFCSNNKFVMQNRYASRPMC